MKLWYLILACVSYFVAFTYAQTKSCLIIGAGMSGISAAVRLKQRGYNVTIIEARNRIGGRILTLRNMGAAIDAGAAWIHGPLPPNPLTALADQFTLPRQVTDDNSLVRFTSAGKTMADNDVAASDDTFSNLIDAADTVRSNNDADRALSDLMAMTRTGVLSDEDMNWHFGSNIEFDTGAALERLSAQNWDSDAAYDGDDVILLNGYDQMLANMVSQNQINIIFNQTVTTIRYGLPQGVALITNTGNTYTADRVVCTIPLGVLKAGVVTFDPPLPVAKTNAISNLQIGLTNKVVLQFRTPFWPADVTWFGYNSGISGARGRFCYWLNMHKYVGRGIIVGLLVGQAAQEYESKSDQTTIIDALAALRKMFPTANMDLLSYNITRWNTDPLTRGTYSYTAPFTTPALFDTLLQSVNDRLYFAGEHTNADGRGTVHGAYWSGLNAAALILGEPFPDPGYPDSASSTLLPSITILSCLAFLSLLW